MERNLLDRAIEAISPAAGARRAEARLRLSALRNAQAMYDGASRGHRTQGRKIGSTSADVETRMSLRRLRDVSRDMERNNAYARRGLTVIPTNVVGTGIVPSVRKASSDLVKRKVEALIKSHLDTTDIDYDGRQNYAGLQFTAVRTLARDGEVLAVRYRPKASLKLTVPLQVRLLEADYLDDSKDGPDGNFVNVQGVRYDAAGRRVGYWLFEEHPGNASRAGRSAESKLIPAADVAHLYRIDRPGQTRGVPWLAPGIMTLWDMKDYEEAELIRQKVAACFAGFETNTNAGQTLAGAATTKAGTPVDILEPGMIHRMAPGSEITFATPPQVTGYPDYIRMNLRKVASSLDVPFNEIASDDSQENFASSRRGYIVFQRVVEVWRWQAVIPQFCDPIGQWFLEAATVPLGGPPRAELDHTPPRRELISPKEEVPMMRDMIRSGLMTRRETLRSLGYDPEAVEAEFVEENRSADMVGNSFDSDGRRPVTGPLPDKDTPQ
ncbi:phage portal protein [Bosea sp. F3-2]|uniref:phage portal protein n=1 Tax=Bosea sp. F3-2 TaxID=2599640 RepID=UPI0011ED4FEA|nr:phage portal protein [Bosea sp. F3-2]QEL26145.1 phage portal protein [Bosea sp. F3-2]